METTLIVGIVVVTSLGVARALGGGTALGVLLGWAALTSALALSGFYSAFDHLPPRISLGVLLPLVAAMVAWQTIPAVRRKVAEAPLALLIVVQVNRLVIGVLFLHLFGLGVLPGRFALTAGWGDIVVGALALGAAAGFASGRPWARGTALLWNILGFCDLAAVVCIGQLSAPTPVRVFFDETSTAALATFPLVLIPTWVVPLTFFIHFVVFQRLVHEGEKPAAVLHPAS